MPAASSAPWTPLRLRSHYSIGVGTASVTELVTRLASDGIRAAALTDLDNLHAMPRFHARCREHGIRPLTGVELTEPDRGPREESARERRRPTAHPSFWNVPWNAPAGTPRSGGSRVVLLARDRTGYERICRLITLRWQAQRGRAPVPAAEPADAPPFLARLLGRVGTDGLFVLTDDPTLATALRRQACVRPDALRLLLVRPRPPLEERRLRTVAERLGAPLVADPDPLVVEPEDRPLHLLLRAVHGGGTVAATSIARADALPTRFVSGRDEVASRFGDVPEALAEGHRLASECHHDLLGEPLPLPRPPWIPLPDAPARLAARVNARLEEARSEGRYGDARYPERVQAELGAIDAHGLAGYFLVVAEVLEGARKNRISVAGRGSAVASLVGHLLGLSPVDPVEAGLDFQRFIHRRRADLPDIDVDVSSPRREELIDWTHERFGAEHVALACAFHRFGRRSAWTEGLKALGVSAPRAERALEALPPDGVEDDGAIDALLDDVPSWAPAAIRRLVGRPRHVAVHPGGVVVAPVPMERVAPVQETQDGRRIVHFDAASLSALGIPKIDLLGSRALAEIDVATSHLAATGELPADLRVELERQGPSAIPAGDPETLRAIDRADTLGVAELETPAVRALLEQVPIRGLKDVVAVLALVRPGASAGRAKLRFVRRVSGEAGAQRRGIPLLERVLEETHGVLLYEEDIMRVISVSTGLDLAEADEVRRELVQRQDDPDSLLRMESAFSRLASSKGIEEDEARAIWSELARFAAYSFNKAHASGHALLAYQGAFLRTRAPVAFACGVLEHHGGAYPPRTIAAGVARQGVEIRGPHVARSHTRTLPEGARAVRLGLGRVKGLSAVTSRRIVTAREERGYADFDDFLDRARPSSSEAAKLLLLGACDGLEPVEADLYPFLHEALGDAVRDRRAEIATTGRQLALHVRRRLGDHESERIVRYRALVRVRNELQHLEMHPSIHPMGILRPEAEELGCRPVARAAAAAGERVRVAALLGAARRVPTRESRRLRFLTLEDESGLLEAILHSDVEWSQGRLVTTPGPYLIEGVVRDDHGHRYLDVTEIRPFHWRRSGADAGAGETAGVSRRG